MSEASPGPWELAWQEGCYGVVGCTTDGKFIAITGFTRGDDERVDAERAANARLIAVAPEMFAALERGLSLAGGWREAITLLEDYCAGSPLGAVRLKNMVAAADQLDDWAQQARAALAKAREGAA
jgi:hypothetical protein